MEVLTVLLILATIALFARQSGNSQKIKELTLELHKLQTRLRRAEAMLQGQGPIQATAPPSIAKQAPEKAAEKTPSRPPIESKPPPPKPVPQRTPVNPPPRQKEKPLAVINAPTAPRREKTIAKTATAPKKRQTTPEFWRVVEKRFAENWIGTLGAIALVLGIGFLGVYAAVNLMAIHRFFMLIGVAGLLWGGSVYMGKKPKYASISAYMSSSSGAVLLFACLGAGGIPGLQWIQNAWLAYFLLCVGILVNLYLGYVGKKQVFAALHVMLSLVALGVGQMYAAPDNLFIFGTGAVVAVFGIALTFRHKWQYHLLAIILAFFLFHVNWYVNATGFGTIELTRFQHLMAMGSIILVGIFAVLAHYREAYETPKLDLLPFVTHLLNWALILSSLLPHTTGSRWKTLLIFCGGISLFWLARKARELRIPWLYRTDSVVSVVMCAAAIGTLFTWQWTLLPIAALVFGLAIVFMLVMEWEKEEFLYRIGAILLHGALLTVAIAAILALGANGRATIGESVIVLITALAAIAFHLFTEYKGQYSDQVFGTSPFENQAVYSLTGWFGAAMLGLVMFMLMPYVWGMWVIGAMMIGVMMVYTKLPSSSLRLGLQIAMGIGLVTFGVYVGTEASDSDSYLGHLANYLPLVLVFGAAMVFRLEKKGVSIAALAFALLIPMVYLPWFGEGNVEIIAVTTLMVAFIYLGRRFSPPTFDLAAHLSFVLVFGVFIGTIMLASDFGGRPDTWELILAVGAFWVMMAAYLFLPAKHPDASPNYPLAGIWITISSLALTFLIGTQSIFSHYLILLPALGMLYLQTKPAYRQLRSGAIALPILLGILYLPNLIETYQGIHALVSGAPYLLIGLFAATSSRQSPTDQVFPRLGIYMTGLLLFFLTFVLLEPIHSTLVGVSWLTLSLVALGLAQFLRMRWRDEIEEKGMHDRYLLHVGYMFMAMAIVAHSVAYFSIETEMIGIPVPWLAAALSLSVLAIWILVKKPAKEPIYGSWKWAHPLLVEVLLLWGLTILFVEVKQVEWLPAVWVVIAGLCLAIGNLKPDRFSRLRAYALLLSAGTALIIMFHAAMVIRVETPFISSDSLGLAIGIVMLFVFIYLFYVEGNLSNVRLPEPIDELMPIVKSLDQYRNYILLFPTLIATAVFLYCSFEHQVLTLLWMVECFAIFSLSIVLRDHFFRYTAMACVGVCMIRLPFFDLQHAGTLERALSLVGVGVILIVMDYVYKRFKHRFDG